MNTNTNCPTTFFDTQQVSLSRKKAQKSFEKDDPWKWFVLRRISIFISCFIVKRTRITANMLTIIGCLFGIAASISMLFGTNKHIILGFIFYQLAYLLDCVDGEVARLKETISNLGVWIDLGLSYSLSLTFIACIISIFKTNTEVVRISIIYIALVSLILNILASEGAELINGKSTYDEMTKTRKKSVKIDLIVFLFATSPGFFIVILLLTIINLFYPVHLLIEIWAILHLFLYFLKSIYRTKIALSKFR